MRVFCVRGCNCMMAIRTWALLAVLFVGVASIVSCTSAEDAVIKGDEQFSAGQYEDAAEHYGNAIEVLPDDAELRLKRAMALARAGKYAEAMADYDTAITLAPDDINAHMNRGVIRGILGDFPGASTDHRTVLEVELLTPEQAALEHGQWHGSFTMWTIYLGRGDFDKAISEYDTFIRLSPDQADAYMWRGCAYYLKGEDARAIEDYNKALTIDPANSFALYKRGLAYARLGNGPQALQDFRAALDIGFDEAGIRSVDDALLQAETPQPSTHEQGLFHLNRGLDRLKQADYDNAVADMDKARKLMDPQLIHLYIDTMHEVYFQSGIAYYDTGLYDQAVLLFDKALDVVPVPSDYPATLYQRGLSHYRENRHRQAMADLEKVLHLEQEFPDAAHYHRMAQEKLSQ